ncbi:transcriptional regulator, partial [Salmonella enterica subsp. salamae]|nr:transcriptional regulator [Salmonella enterica subsp. salamae]
MTDISEVINTINALISSGQLTQMAVAKETGLSDATIS